MSDTGMRTIGKGTRGGVEPVTVQRVCIATVLMGVINEKHDEILPYNP